MDISIMDSYDIDEKIQNDYSIIREKMSINNPSFDDCFYSACRFIIYNYQCDYIVNCEENAIVIISDGSIEKNNFFIKYVFSFDKDGKMIVNISYNELCELDNKKVLHKLEMIDRYDEFGVLSSHVEYEGDTELIDLSLLNDCVNKHVVWEDFNTYPKISINCDDGKIQLIMRDIKCFGVARVIELGIKNSMFDGLKEEYYMLDCSYPLSLCLDNSPFMFYSKNDNKYFVDKNRFGDIDKNDAYRLATTMYIENIKNTELEDIDYELYNHILSFFEK